MHFSLSGKHQFVCLRVKNLCVSCDGWICELIPANLSNLLYLCACFQQQKNLEGYVGFASLPNQVYRKSVKRGFEFTLMVVGKKTTVL